MGRRANYEEGGGAVLNHLRRRVARQPGAVPIGTVNPLCSCGMTLTMARMKSQAAIYTCDGDATVAAAVATVAVTFLLGLLTYLGPVYKAWSSEKAALHA